jgi:hypothetical protein
MTEHPPFPEPLEDDDDDVAWALQTAKVQWTRGGQADAIVWLRRAVDSADHLGHVWRAADLRRMTDELVTFLARPSRRPPAPLPRFEVGDQLVDDLLSARDSARDSGVTSVPPPAAPFRRATVPPQSSYAPVDDAEFEDDIVLEDDDDDDGPQLGLAQSRESAVELRDSEVELTDDVAIIGDDDLEDDVIDDDALDIPARAAAGHSPAPARHSPVPARHSPVPARHPYDSEELPTHPLIDSNRFPLSLLGPPVSAPLPPEEDPHVGGVLLGEVHGLEDVPPEGQAILAREARLERLGVDEEISAFGLALVLRGAVKVMPAIADLACARAAKGEIVWSEGNLEDGVALRLVAGEDATEVAVWDAELLKGIVRDYPWVVEDLRNLADRFQALAGVAMGPMGERLDDSLRAMVTDRCEIKRLLPGELLTTQGKGVGGMYIMAAGRLEIMNGDQVDSELGPGDFLFGAQVLSNGKAPNDARAGKGGALVLFASRSIAHELLLSVPPLLEIFAS